MYFQNYFFKDIIAPIGRHIVSPGMRRLSKLRSRPSLYALRRNWHHRDLGRDVPRLTCLLELSRPTQVAADTALCVLVSMYAATAWTMESTNKMNSRSTMYNHNVKIPRILELFLHSIVRMYQWSVEK